MVKKRKKYVPTSITITEYGVEMQILTGSKVIDDACIQLSGQEIGSNYDFSSEKDLLSNKTFNIDWE